jgi:hypothetical protein
VGDRKKFLQTVERVCSLKVRLFQNP